jgi:putative (di)nucleoside polyphosphate hydrolase
MSLSPEQIAELPYRPCMGVMLVNTDGRVFVGQRMDYKSDAWQMPQGGIDPGETPREAALRELWEETGVTADLVEIETITDDWLMYDLPPELLGNLWGGKYRGQKQKWALMRFLGSDDQINIATDHPEFSRWQWLAPSDLVANIVPFKREVYEQVLAGFADRLDMG